MYKNTKQLDENRLSLITINNNFISLKSYCLGLYPNKPGDNSPRNSYFNLYWSLTGLRSENPIGKICYLLLPCLLQVDETELLALQVAENRLWILT